MLGDFFVTLRARLTLRARSTDRYLNYFSVRGRAAGKREVVEGAGECAESTGRQCRLGMFGGRSNSIRLNTDVHGGENIYSSALAYSIRLSLHIQ